jgi:hypothetical protein
MKNLTRREVLKSGSAGGKYSSSHGGEGRSSTRLNSADQGRVCYALFGEHKVANDKK